MHWRKIRVFTILIAAGLGLSLLAAPAGQTAKDKAAPPIDPQRVQDQDVMTFADYKPIPGKNWADPSLKPERGFKLAVVGTDFPDQPFVITLPKNTDPFGNPQIDPVSRETVPRFYADFSESDPAKSATAVVSVTNR